MAEFSLGPEFERFQRDMQEQMGDFTKVQESIRATVGHGEAADGRIVAEYAAEGGVTKIGLAHELGVQQQRVREAMDDYEGPGSPGPR